MDFGFDSCCCSLWILRPSFFGAKFVSNRCSSHNQVTDCFILSFTDVGRPHMTACFLFVDKRLAVEKSCGRHACNQVSCVHSDGHSLAIVLVGRSVSFIWRSPGKSTTASNEPACETPADVTGSVPAAAVKAFALTQSALVRVS